MSGPKGSALAIMVEVLCGVLSGGRFAADLGNLYTNCEKPQDVGHFFLVLDPGRLIHGSHHAERTLKLVMELQSSETAEGHDQIYMPGEIEMERAATALAKGIEIPGNVVNDLNTVADRLGIPPLRPDL